jgi:hypothetical protein
MRNILGLKIETKLSLFIVVIFVSIFLFTVFKSMDNFNKFIDIYGRYEELRIK